VCRAALTEDKRREAYRVLEEHILNGAGTASPEQRALVFSSAGLSQPLTGLVGKVATRASKSGASAAFG
jgi:hypothetical protein